MTYIKGTTRAQTIFLRAFRKNPAGPPPDQWPDQDVIAAGADLEPATLLAAYRRGIFPMPLDIPERAEPLLAWWSPEVRGILPLDKLRLTRPASAT